MFPVVRPAVRPTNIHQLVRIAEKGFQGQMSDVKGHDQAN